MERDKAVQGPRLNDFDGVRSLTDHQIHQFICDGYVKIERAFERGLADQCRSILWRDTGCEEAEPATWMKPVIRLGIYGQLPFASAANAPVLKTAFDPLVGPERWRPRVDLGMFLA
jgi:hypothetical protein